MGYGRAARPDSRVVLRRGERVAISFADEDVTSLCASESYD